MGDTLNGEITKNRIGYQIGVSHQIRRFMYQLCPTTENDRNYEPAIIFYMKLCPLVLEGSVTIGDLSHHCQYPLVHFKNRITQDINIFRRVRGQ